MHVIMNKDLLKQKTGNLRITQHYSTYYVIIAIDNTVQQLFSPCLKFMFYDASVCPKYGIDSHFLETTTLGK